MNGEPISWFAHQFGVGLQWQSLFVIMAHFLYWWKIESSDEWLEYRDTFSLIFSSSFLLFFSLKRQRWGWFMLHVLAVRGFCHCYLNLFKANMTYFHHADNVISTQTQPPPLVPLSVSVFHTVSLESMHIKGQSPILTGSLSLTYMYS